MPWIAYTNQMSDSPPLFSQNFSQKFEYIQPLVFLEEKKRSLFKPRAIAAENVGDTTVNLIINKSDGEPPQSRCHDSWRDRVCPGSFEYLQDDFLPCAVSTGALSGSIKAAIFPMPAKTSFYPGILVWRPLPLISTVLTTQASSSS